jgi:hypothetical protein
MQIPLFFWLYKNGAGFFKRLPPPWRSFFNTDLSGSRLGRWASPLGGLGIMLVAALPTFGGGMWSAVFIAYGLNLRRRASYIWMTLGSTLSYLSIYWVLATLIGAIRYFSKT